MQGSHFHKKKNSPSQIPYLKKTPKMEKCKKLQKNAPIAYNMKGCFRFYTFIFSSILAKYIYGLSPLEQHHKIENK
jgi:hypothetical protein